MQLTLADSVSIRDESRGDDSGTGDMSGVSCPHGQQARREAYKPSAEQFTKVYYVVTIRTMTLAVWRAQANRLQLCTIHLCPCVILLGVSGVAQLSRSDSKVNDDGEGDDVWVELLPVQLVDTHRAWFLHVHKSHSIDSGQSINTFVQAPACEKMNPMHLITPSVTGLE